MMAAALAMGGLVMAEVESGLGVGTPVPPFNTKDTCGENAGKSLCYRWLFGTRPVVAIFARTTSDDLTSLVKKVDALIEANKAKQLRSYLVLLADDADEAEETLIALGKKNNINHVKLTVFDGIAGPPKYQISKDADLTVLHWKGRVVAKNNAYTKAEFNSDAIKEVIESAKGSILK